MRLRFLFSLVLLSFFPSPLYAADYLTYAGATTLQQFFMPEAGKEFTQATGIPVKILGGNTGPGLAALMAGEIDVAGAGRFLTGAEKKKGLVENLIGWDAVTVLVHESNKIHSLSLVQLRGIFSGQIRNWREVGGVDGPILVIAPPPGSGIRDLIAEQILQSSSFTPKEIISPLVSDVDRHVAVFPLAIGALSTSMVDTPGTRFIRVEGHLPTTPTVMARQYPLIKPLLLVTRGEPSGPAGRFVAFAQGEAGQRIIARQFFRAR